MMTAFAVSSRFELRIERWMFAAIKSILLWLVWRRINAINRWVNPFHFWIHFEIFIHSPIDTWRGCFNQLLLIWDIGNLPASANPKRLTKHQGRIEFVSFSPTGTLLAAIDGNSNLVIWDTKVKQMPFCKFIDKCFFYCSLDLGNGCQRQVTKRWQRRKIQILLFMGLFR